MDNKAFVMYADILPRIDMLSREQMGDLFRAILTYVDNGEQIEMDAVTNMAFGFIRDQIDRDQTKYRETCERRKEAARKRWDANASFALQTNANECKAMHPEPDPDPEPDPEPEPDNNNINGGGSAKAVRFVPPSIADVQNYADSKDLKIDAEQFVDFYGSKGWTVGKSPMKDWRAAVRNWCKRERGSPVKKNNFTIVNGRDNSGKYAALESALLGRG